MQSVVANPGLATLVRLRVAASSVLRANAATIDSWRRQPIVVGSEKLPVPVLRHAEDQTLLALKAVIEARTQLGNDDVSFTDWGVIAAPTFFGRVSIAQTLQRFQHEGAWGVSPHLIPHQSLHAVSGTISQMLKIHGPNFGVNGGPNSAPDAFLFTAALMMDGTLPGLWLVLTGYDAEWIPDANGVHPVAPDGVAIALALTPKSHDSGLRLTIGHVESASEGIAHLPMLDVGLLAETSQGLELGKWRISDTHWLEIDTLPELVEERT